MPFELNCLFQSLVIDQTIEKVSFCTPDPGNDRVFSYICREGTTRRWMCHSFIALRDTVSWHSNLPSTLWFKVLLVLKIVRPLSCDQCPVTQRQRKKDGLVWNFKIKGENWITTYLTCRWKLNDEMIPISLLYAHFFFKFLIWSLKIKKQLLEKIFSWKKETESKIERGYLFATSHDIPHHFSQYLYWNKQNGG